MNLEQSKSFFFCKNLQKGQPERPTVNTTQFPLAPIPKEAEKSKRIKKSQSGNKISKNVVSIRKRKTSKRKKKKRTPPPKGTVKLL